MIQFHIPWEGYYDENLSDQLVNAMPGTFSYAQLRCTLYYKFYLFCKQNKCGHRNVLSKRQVWMSIFHIINFKKKNSWTQGSWIFLIKNLSWINILFVNFTVK
jgi:hypothetical protein